MPEERRGPGNDVTVPTAPADLGAESVLAKLAPDGGFEGVSVRGLEEEPALPEIRTGGGIEGHPLTFLHEAL